MSAFVAIGTWKALCDFSIGINDRWNEEFEAPKDGLVYICKAWSEFGAMEVVGPNGESPWESPEPTHVAGSGYFGGAWYGFEPAACGFYWRSKTSPSGDEFTALPREDRRWDFYCSPAPEESKTEDGRLVTTERRTCTYMQIFNELEWQPLSCPGRYSTEEVAWGQRYHDRRRERFMYNFSVAMERRNRIIIVGSQSSPRPIQRERGIYQQWLSRLSRKVRSLNFR